MPRDEFGPEEEDFESRDWEPDDDEEARADNPIIWGDLDQEVQDAAMTVVASEHEGAGKDDEEWDDLVAAIERSGLPADYLDEILGTAREVYRGTYREE